MIRIDLLTSAEERAAGFGAGPRGRMLALGAPAMLAAALVLMGWWSWTLHVEAAAVSRALAEAEASLRSLAPAIEDARAAEERRTELRGRLDRLEALHARRHVAARMLSGVSRALPDDLWFTELHAEDGGVILRGHAATLASVSDYAAALDASREFGRPVEIVDSQRDPGGGVRFEFRMSFPGAGGR